MEDTLLVDDDPVAIGLLERAPDGAWALLPQNSKASRCVDPSQTQPCGQFSPLPELLTETCSSLAGASACSFEHRCRRDGQEHICRVQLQRTKGAGELQQVLWVASDVTRLRAQGAELQRLEYAAHGARDGLWDWRVDTGEVYFSPRWCEMLGYTQAEVRPHVSAWSGLVHTADTPMVMEVLQAHLRGETEYYETEHRVRHKQGHWVWILDRGRVMERAPDGSPVRMVGHHTDLTRQKEAEGRLLLEQERLRSLTDLLPVGIYVCDLKGRCTYVNPTKCEMTGRRPEDFLGEAWRSTIHPEDLPAVLQAWGSFFQEGAPFLPRYRILRSDGGAIWVSGRAIIIRDEQGQPTGVLGTVLDITHEKEQELRAQEQQAQLSATARLAALGEMAAGIAHELNTPLGVISLTTGHLRALQSSGALRPEALMRSLDRMDSTSAHMSRVIRSLRNFARDGMHEPPSRVELRLVIDELLNLCQERLRYYDIQLRVELEPGLAVYAAATPLSQVLLNLINNAKDAVKGLSEPWICLAGTRRGAEVVITVADSGPGIPPDLRSRIFEPFFTTREPGSGTGLGLSMSRGILRSYNGTLQLDSEHPYTQFMITLPAAPKTEENS